MKRQELVKELRERASQIAVGHPHPDLLTQAADALEEQGRLLAYLDGLDSSTGSDDYRAGWADCRQDVERYLTTPEIRAALNPPAQGEEGELVIDADDLAEARRDPKTRELLEQAEQYAKSLREHKPCPGRPDCTEKPGEGPTRVGPHEGNPTSEPESRIGKTPPPHGGEGEQTTTDYERAIEGLPVELVAALNDRSVFVKEDVDVFRMIAEYRDAPSNTVSADPRYIRPHGVDEGLIEAIEKLARELSNRYGRHLELACHAEETPGGEIRAPRDPMLDGEIAGLEIALTALGVDLNELNASVAALAALSDTGRQG